MELLPFLLGGLVPGGILPPLLGGLVPGGVLPPLLVGVLPPELSSLFPRGVLPYLLGGLLVGLGVAVIYLGTGIIAGASTFLEAEWSYVSDRDRFNRPRFRRSRDWRLLFTAGIVVGAAMYGLVLEPGIWTTDVQPWRLLAGGFLVGVGTRLGKGCTSGHGVCGVGSLSGTSIANVVTFLGVAVGTAALVQAFGVTP